MIYAGIIGVTGYAGAELLRLLLTHPSVDGITGSSVSFEGKTMTEVYPSFRGRTNLSMTDENRVIESSNVVFAALPHGLSEDVAAKCLEKNTRFIDLGADFRLVDGDEYKQWYEKDYTRPEIHFHAVYGLPELFRSMIGDAKIIANPGCYPTSAALGLYPALAAGLVETSGIIIDAKSGVTGAGRGLTQTTHFSEANESFSPYNVAKHRHTPEIEQTLSVAAGARVKVTFVPHLLPLNRGIVSTIYAPLKPGATMEKIRAQYEERYANEPFVRVLPDGQAANLRNVRMSNYCDISLHADPRTETFIAVSAIDNMVKGAAGQAIQNMNIMFGLDETAGIGAIPPAF